MKWYLCGPMSGVPQFNVPLFDRVTAELRARGMDVTSPAELDSPAVRAAALESVDGKPGAQGSVANETWGDMLARDVKIIADELDGIILLPGWWRSRGARLEVFVGLLCDRQFMRVCVADDGDIAVLDEFASEVRTTLRSNLP